MTRSITVRSGSVPRKVIPPASAANAAGADTDAIHDNVDGEIVLVTEKVSPVGADVLLIEDSAASNAKKRVQITNLPGGADADAIHDNVASEISAITAKGTPVGGDFLIIEDSAAANVKKSMTVAALEAVISHDSIADVSVDDHHAEAHNVASHSDTTATGAELETLTDGSDADALHTHSADGIDTSAIHDNESAEISVITEKGSPVNADLLLIEDSAASNVKKRIQIGNLPGTGGGTNLTTKGDLHGYDTGQARIPVGATDGHVLVVDSAEALGVKWAAGAGGTDSDAIHDNVDAEISAIAAKGSPTDADFLLIEDAAASDAKKRITIGDLPGGGGGGALDDLDDVEAFAPSDGDVLVYQVGSIFVDEAPTGATASTTYNGNTPDRAIDTDNTGTFWWSAAPSSSSWLRVDLGTVKTIGRIITYMPSGDRPTAMTIQGSDNDSDWTPVSAVSVTGGTEVWNFAPTPFRYWRLLGTAGGSWWKLYGFDLLSVVSAWSAELATTIPDFLTLDGSRTMTGPVEMTEISAPSAPAADTARLYVEDNGSGKTRLMVRFATGAVQQIAIEP